MIEILARHFESNLVKAPIPVEILEGATRVKGMLELNRMVTRDGIAYRQKKLTRDVKTLQRVSQSYLPSRAIKLIRDGVCHTEWAIRAKNSEKEEELVSQIEIVTDVLDNPNPKDDDFGTFLGQIIEDILIFDAGAFEYIVSPLWMDKNPHLQLSVIPGYMLAENIKWEGDPDENRWVQITPEGKVGAIFLDSEIEYIMQRKRSWTAWGFSPLESAIELMESWLGLSNYQRNVGSNTYPRFMLYIGEQAEETQVETFRSYWRNELLGQGLPGIWGGGSGKPEVLDLKPTGDTGLYLKYQEMLIRSFAYSFGLKAQDFNLERDVNRSQGEVSQSASVEEARKPPAMLVAKKINVRVIPAIANAVADERIKELEFYWIGLDPRDAKADAEVHHIYADDEVLILDEIRADLGHPPLPGRLGRMTKAALQELVKQNPYVFLDEEDIKEFAELEEIRKGVLGLDEEVVEIEPEPQPLLSAGEQEENEVYISLLNE